MTCNRFRTLIQQRFDQDLTTQDHRALINHLEGCESCAKFDHQLDQMIQAAQDTPAPDEVRPQNPEALARLIMEQLPQKKGSVINMIMGIFGGGASPGGKPKSQKAMKAPKEQKATAALKGGSSAIKDKAPKGKGGKPKEKFAPGDLEEDRRPGGVTFGRKKEEGVDADAIESQVGTFSRLKSISSNRTPEQLDRDAQSTTRSLGEKFGMPGANTILEEGPLTLAESIKRKVSESQRMSPLDDDPDASGSIMQAQDNTGGAAYGRSDSMGGMGGGGAAGGGNWGPPAFAGQPKPMGQTAGDGDKGDWGAPGGIKPAPGQTFPAPGPVGLDEHPGSSIGLAPPGSKRPMTSEQPSESTKAGIGLSAPAPGGGMDWGTPKTPTAGGGGGWGATDAAKPAPAAAGGQSGWTSGWGGEGDGQAPLKSSDSWAVPGSESTNSWGQPSDSPSGGFSNPAGAPGGEAAAPAPAQAAPASPTDPWAPPAGTWGAGQAAADAANAGQGKATGDEAWGAAANAHATAPATDPWGTAPAPNIKIELQAQPAAPAASDAWGSAPTPAAPAQNEAWGAAAAAAPAPAQSDAWGATAAPAPAPTQADAWGNTPAAPAPAQAEAWGAAPEAAPAQADAWGNSPASAPAPADAWGNAPAAAPVPAQADAWGAAPGPGPAQADAWGNTPASNPAPAQADAWGAAPGAAPAQADAWGAAPASAPAAAHDDAWGAAPASAPAAAQGDAWGAQPAAPAAQNSAWGAAAAAPPATPAPAPAAAQADAWGSAPAAPAPASDGWGGAAPQPSWGAAPNAAPTGAAPAASDWGAAPAVMAAPTPAAGEPVNGLAAQYSTIPPGQFATPANAGTAIASSGWGQAPNAPEPLDAAQIEAKKNAWAQEAEQLETGTWRAFAPKMNEGLGSVAPPLPSPGPAPTAPAPQAAGGDRWDLPIQERGKSQTEMPVAQPPEAAPPVMPIQPVAAQTAAQQRWDVPIQERAKMEAEAPQAAPAMPPMGMPPGAVGSPVMSSGIPVNQIVEKMGQVLGGTSQAASAEAQESRWDVPIQERMKTQSSQDMPVVPAAAVAPAQQASSWGQPAAFDAPPAPAPVAPAADTSWGTSANSWGQDPAAAPAVASGWDSQPAAAQAASSGWDAQPAAAPAVASGWDMQPAAAPNNGGWGSGDAIPQPAAQPTSSWGQPAGSSWGEAPSTAAVGQPAQSAAPAGQTAWGNDTAAGGWGQPPAPMANSWATAPATTPAAAAPPPPPPPPPQPPAIKPEITDKVQGGGLLTGIDDKAIDRIFGEIGVQEPVSKGLVNSGGEPVSNFSPPASPAPEPMAAAAPPPPMPAQAFAQPGFPQAANAAPEAPKGLLGGIDDNAIDRIFSQNLGVSEPSVPVGRGAEMATAGAVSNNWASAAPAAVPAPQAQAAVEPAAGSGWGAPPAASGWGQPPAVGQTPSPEAPAAAGNSGWGMAPIAASSQWGQAPQAAESGPPKLFSVDDMAMDKIFENNLGIKDGQQAANAQDMSAVAHMPPPAPFAAPLPTAADMPAPEAAFQGGPPPKIEGIGRLDAGGDQNQDAGSGRIASIGKFLLDQKDLDKIGKLTNTDFNDSKLRILTKENSDDLQALLGQIGTQKGVVGSVIVGHDGLLIANTMPSDMDAESVGVWALGVYMNTEHVTKKMGHDRVHQVVSRTPRGYVIIADFGGGLLVTVTEGKDTDSLIPLMRTITQLVN